MWDCDNIMPRGQEHVRLRERIEDLARAAEVRELLAFANTATVGSRRPSALELEAAGWSVAVSAQNVRQSADTLLRGAVARFCSEHRSDGGIVLVSNDSGFAGDVVYARHVGAAVVVVNRLILSDRGQRQLARWRRSRMPELTHIVLWEHNKRRGRPDASQADARRGWRIEPHRVRLGSEGVERWRGGTQDVVVPEGRHVGVFWDCENLCPGGGDLEALARVAEHVESLVPSHARSVTQVTALAQATVSRTGASGARHVRDRLARWEVLVVNDAPEAADVALRARIDAFALAHEDDGAIILVSEDAGFAPDLAYASSLGCRTVSVGCIVAGADEAAQEERWARSSVGLVAHVSLLWRAQNAAAHRPDAEDVHFHSLWIPECEDDRLVP
ncbi:unnamed protein product [Pedinophyceae sp. YPF-701]|nr:unnamed protein product [Pedinophyceae sp. YPF-701]